jgi:hypothetical protein
MLSPDSSFSSSISVSVSLDDSACMLTLSYCENVLLFVPNSLFIAGFFDSEKNSSTDTPATATCKEKLLIVLQNSLLFVLLDIRKQNILVFDEEWVGRLLDFPTFGVVERNI